MCLFVFPIHYFFKYSFCSFLCYCSGTPIMLISGRLVVFHRSFRFSLFSFLSQITCLNCSIFTFILPFFWELTSVMELLHHFFFHFCFSTFQHQDFIFSYENNLYLYIDILNIDICLTRNHYHTFILILSYNSLDMISFVTVSIFMNTIFWCFCLIRSTQGFFKDDFYSLLVGLYISHTFFVRFYWF